MNEDQKNIAQLQKTVAALEEAVANLTTELHKRDQHHELQDRETQDKLRQLEGWAKNASFNNR